MGVIALLPESVANKIAAGEVIERPASVVKELVENSIDAGATRIVVDLSDGGRKLIRVTDNGSGMDETDAPAAFRRFATSKLRSEQDLETIRTLGFRGEALPSIGEVSRFTLTTRPAGQTAGTCVVYSGGEQIRTVACACAEGTAAEVQNLFFNVPARRKFMKTPQAETTAVVNLLTTYALTRPDITFRLMSNDRELLFSEATGDRAARILSLFGREVAESLLPVSFADGEVRLEGFALHPRLTRQNRAWQYFFVNGRPVTCPALYFGVQQAYRALIFRERHPACFLWISLPTDRVDVNIHPTKKEIKFADEQAVRAAVSHALENALVAARIFAPDEPASQPQAAAPVREPSAAYTPEASFPRASAGFRPPAPAFSPDAGGRASDAPLPGHGGPGPVRILGQFDRTYIVAEQGAELILFDQHAAHERVLYERLLNEARTRPAPSQRLLTPCVLDLPAAHALLLLENREALLRLGIEVNDCGGQTLSIEALPAAFSSVDPVPFLSDLADLLGAEGAGGETTVEGVQEKLVRAACRAAVKARHALGPAELASLLAQLEGCRTPQSCPHGRPTSIRIGRAELEKRFKRRE